MDSGASGGTCEGSRKGRDGWCGELQSKLSGPKPQGDGSALVSQREKALRMQAFFMDGSGGNCEELT